MLKIDLHLHSQYSEDGIGTPKEIMNVLQKKGFNGMAVTDHNTIKGSLEALKLKPKDFVIIPGVEISTRDGHMLAIGIKENIPRNLTVEETVDKILDNGGIPIPPHLFRNMSGIKKNKLNSIHKKINVIEIFNGCSLPNTNIKTAKIAREYNLGGTGGSDAHEPSFAGYGYTVIDTTDTNLDSILSEINKKKTWGEGTSIPLDIRRERMLLGIKQFFQRGFKRI